MSATRTTPERANSKPTRGAWTEDFKKDLGLASALGLGSGLGLGLGSPVGLNHVEDRSEACNSNTGTNASSKPTRGAWTEDFNKELVSCLGVTTLKGGALHTPTPLAANAASSRGESAPFAYVLAKTRDGTQHYSHTSHRARRRARRDKGARAARFFFKFNTVSVGQRRKKI